MAELSRKNLEYFYSRFHKISIENEISSNIISGLYALNQTDLGFPLAFKIYLENLAKIPIFRKYQNVGQKSKF